jgi:ornithine carbamoyltransferase
MAHRHFLTLMDFSAAELQQLLLQSIALKAEHKAGKINDTFKNKVLGMVFEKSSTRTRVSFEAGMAQMGGHAIFLSPKDTQLGRGEPIEDVARVMSRMVDIIMIRTYKHSKIELFAQHSQVPVINGLTDSYHPCQVLADIQTFIEQRGSIKGKKVAWIGDGNNMCQTFIHAAEQFDFELVIACPTGFEPDAALVKSYQHRVSVTTSPEAAVKHAHLVATDVWASMGHEEEAAQRKIAFQHYQVTRQLLDKAASDVLFMHCLPAHRGEEVSEDLLDDPRAVAWDEAENRLHVQKALMISLASPAKTSP